jgi:PPOX class probable F420-dependent enzyme
MGSVAQDEQGYVEDRLAREVVIWLTTMRPDGQPQTSPVWFVWDGASFLIYSMPASQKVPNIRRSGRVALNLDGDGKGGGIVSFEGEARLDEGAPLAHEVPAYADKYRALIEGMGSQPEPFARAYSTAIRVTPTRRRVYR